VHIDLGMTVTGSMSTDIDDSICVDRYVTQVGRFAGAIVDQAIANDQVMGCAGGTDRSRGQRRDRESHYRDGA
jgi:hypothetical protein